MTTAEKITKQLKALGNKTAAEHAQRFFKTGPGQYGEGDLFLGIRVPVLRKLAKELNSPTPACGHPSRGGDSLKSPPREGCRNGGVGFVGISLDDIVELLQSPFHEARMAALLIMVLQAKWNGAAVYRAYLANTAKINNWDLVDVSAAQIVGAHLFCSSRSAGDSIPPQGCSSRPVGDSVCQRQTATEIRKPLYTLAKSNSLWERRIAIIATFHFIRKNDFDDTLAIADILLNDTEDLMHKAVGWMLREVGKRDLKTEEDFLLPRYQNMPRTMLRYAIEKFPEPLRQKYLKGKM
jgi:3-methyladenine DNA glycosylase AlkD